MRLFQKLKKQIYVDYRSGCDLCGNGSYYFPYASIPKAIDHKISFFQKLIVELIKRPFMLCAVHDSGCANRRKVPSKEIHSHD